MTRRLKTSISALAALALAACSGGGGRGAPISGSGLDPQLVYCRQQIGKEDLVILINYEQAPRP